jgi:hypothetical protein
VLARRQLIWFLLPLVVLASVILHEAPSAEGRGVKWQGNWDASTGHWVGTIRWSFDDGGQRAWTDAEKRVVREAIQEWEDLPDSNVRFDEVTDNPNVTFSWDEPPSGDGETAGEMTGAQGDDPPTGAVFNPNPDAGWYVDADPTTDEPIPDGRWDLLSVAKHEIGHVLGFKHSFGTPEVMDTWGPDDRQHLTESDERAAAHLYPKKS